MANKYVVTSGAVFALVAILQALRAVEQIPVTVGSFAVPVAASWAAALVAAALALLPRRRRGVRRTHARADVWERVRGVPRRSPALDTADDPMAVEMIGGPRLCEPLLATGLGRFTGAASRHANGPRKRTSPHWRSGWVSGASQRATTNSLGTTSQPCASLPPWHSGFNQLSLDPRAGSDVSNCQSGATTPGPGPRLL